MRWSGWPRLLFDVPEAVRVLYHHEARTWWAESPDVNGWSAIGDSYVEIAKLVNEGVPFALGRPTAIEHYVLTNAFPNYDGV